MPSQIDILLRLAPDHPSRILDTLSLNHSLATQQDAHGYSLLHAAASYGHMDLCRTLVHEYNVPVDILDEDGESPLFYAESLDIVQCLVSECGADITLINSEGVGVIEKIEAEGEGAWVQAVLAYLRERTSSSTTTNDRNEVEQTVADELPISSHAPLPPSNVHVNFGTMTELPDGADPTIRRKIEELAAREDYDGESAQGELRRLVEEVVSGLRKDVVEGRDSAQRRRVER